LPEPKIWSIMERLNASNACHYFLVCRPERPKDSYTIDFSAEGSRDYVPMFRHRCGLSGSEIFRPDWRVNLNAAQLPFVQQIDGRRAIREIAEHVAESGSQRGNVAELEKFGRKLFEGLWRYDFLSMGLKATGMNGDPQAVAGGGLAEHPLGR